MNEFDVKAEGWDLNPMHIERSEAVAKQLIERIPLSKSMSALEFGAGTGLTSFSLKDHLKEITMMDKSREMVRKMEEKIRSTKSENLKALLFDLENNIWSGEGFDMLITQMVLHHIADINSIIKKFYNIINPGGYLAIADLYPEDGSFHREGFKGHPGFSPDKLSEIIKKQGFREISVRKCFTINKKITDSNSGQFNVFLLIARHPPVK
jgi:tRNA (cmo5U34)-methyltransferase